MRDLLLALTAREVAGRIGIKVTDWHARVSRDHAPRPVAYDRREGRMVAVWHPLEVDAYVASRARRAASLAGSIDTRPFTIDCPHCSEVAANSWAALNVHITAEHRTA